MYETLFGSKTRVKLLSLLLTSPGQAFFVRELTRRIEEQINSVRRELLNLKSLGIVKSHEKRGKIYYEANPKYEAYPELRKMFEKAEKNLGADDKLAGAIRRAGDVQYVALMGGFVGDNTSQVDIFIVGEIDKRKLKPALSDLEKEIGREANYCIMSESEFEDRSMLFDRFITETMSKPKKVIVDYMKSEVEGS
jgi:DNA-binding transcriptional ArsR family regulator